ncbi:methyl-accepting chemotaxis protein [Vibrio palustris]|uniref:Methyl-accepting chemotaxis protein PctB n=1 Tax=Vibrio palustris TaxID=1918946 RepID=A0A1R4B0J9_9VIBR|nr:methyl-accepting chemotaxis protein [Vibrio palustris]SJL82442.1 Methyl-accepting chemotaxis protein PctB [Vibrio palustris]
MKIKHKILSSNIILCLIFVVLSCLILSYEITNKVGTLTKEDARQHLTSVGNTTAERLIDYFHSIESQLVLTASNPTSQTAMEALVNQYFSEPLKQDSFQSLTHFYQNEFAPKYNSLNTESVAVNNILRTIDQRGKMFQSQYISQNPAPLGSKDQLVHPPIVSAYGDTHAQYHPVYQHILQEMGLYDVFLVDANTGVVVYSVFKELDYATSLKTGPFKDSGLAQAFQNGVNLKKNETYLTDFARYTPSYEAQASFMSTPIVNSAGKTMGVLIYQMPVDKINAILLHKKQWKKEGLGESGETYLVGKDHFMRSEGRFLIDDKTSYFAALKQSGTSQTIINEIDKRNSTMGLQAVNTTGVDEALAGKQGFSTFPDYRNVNVYSSYQPIQIKGVHWALMSEIDESEALHTLELVKEKTLKILILMIIASTVISGLVSWLLARRITKPLDVLLHTVNSLSSGQGDLRVRLTETGSKDELDNLAISLNQFIDYLDVTFSHLLAAIIRMKPMSEDVIDITNSLNTHASHTKSEYQTMQASLEGVLASNQHAEAKLSEIKTASHSAVNEVSEGRHSVQETAKDMHTLQDEIGDVSVAVGELQQHSNEIARIVDVINGIAEQTNLLALNASIEAARAGEMGRGFAVVADEVRALAARTRSSTEDVTKMVNTVRDSTDKVESIIHKGLESTKNCANRVQQTEITWEQVETAMHNIDGHVHDITSLMGEQVKGLHGLSDNFVQLDENFVNTQHTIKLCNVISTDITSISAKMRSVTDTFNVTNTEHSDKRRKEIRKNTEE